MAKAVLELLEDLLYRVDDGGASLGEIVAGLSDHFGALAEADMEEDLRTELFTYCLTNVSEGTYRNYDFHYNLMRAAATLFRDDKQLDRVEEVLKAIEGPYDGEQTTLLRLELLRRFGPDYDADDLTAASLR